MEIGDSMPDFTLNNTEGVPFSSQSLQSKASVVFFYPKNFTPGCTKEVCSFRDSFEEFSDLGVEVVGISGDSTASHKRFSERYSLPFALLSDTNFKVQRLFGVKKVLLGILPGRETFVFDHQGKLIYKFKALGADAHIRNTLKQLNKLS